jgi:hypothetical protein
MTVVAVIVTLHMVRRFAGGCNKVRVVMTALAAIGCALEDGVFVTTITGESGMGTVEQKTGEIMVKVSGSKSMR